MFACFDGCVFPKVPSSYVLAAARYAYLWGDAERGSKYVAPIADAYFQLGIVDDHFLYVRGLPYLVVSGGLRLDVALICCHG